MPDELLLLAQHLREHAAAQNTLGQNAPGNIPAFKDCVRLFIQTQKDDKGNRPISGTFWHSPDLTVHRTGGAAITQIEPGTHYKIQCSVYNGGDLDAQSAILEIFLSNPTLGFRVSTSEPLFTEIRNVPADPALEHPALFEFDWSPTLEQAGHRCLIARISMYNDLPKIDEKEEFDLLDAKRMRHCAQQNLTIIGIQQTLDFNVHRPYNPSEQVRIEIRPLHQLPDSPYLHEALQQFQLRPGNDALQFQISPLDPEGSILQPVGANSWVAVFGQQQATFRLSTPNPALQPGEAMMYEVISIPIPENVVFGGFTLILIG